MSSGVVRFSVSVDPELLEEFDDTISEIGFNRSTAVQVAIREFLTDHKWSATEEGNVAGAITMMYDHHVRGLSETLTHVQHEYLGVISSTTHIHLDHDNCMEILAVKGDIYTIKKLMKSLRTTRGVKQLKFSMLNI